MAMTNASPTAASAAAIAIEKIATMTPMGGCGCGLKRQNATKFKFAAASIISIPIKIKMAWRRLSAASNPMEKSAAEIVKKSVSVGVMASQEVKRQNVTSLNRAARGCAEICTIERGALDPPTLVCKADFFVFVTL